MTEHAYSKTLTAPVEKEGATNRELSDFAVRDFDGVQIGVGLWDEWDDRQKNAYGCMVTLREGAPANRWQTVKAETSEIRDINGIKYYAITQTWSEGPMEGCRDMARADVRAWLTAWEASEFSHLGVVYDINPDQERRLAVSQGQARRVGVGYTASWYAKTGQKVDFPNRDTWEDFYDSFHAHLETGNETADTALTQIAGAGTTLVLDAILAGLPIIPGTVSIRATGPLKGPDVDIGATKPKIRGR